MRTISAVLSGVIMGAVVLSTTLGFFYYPIVAGAMAAVFAIVFGVLALIFLRWIETKDGNYRAFSWMGGVFYEIIQSKIYDLRPGLDGRARVELKDPDIASTSDVGGGYSVFRWGGTVFYLNHFVKPQEVVSLDVPQVGFSMEKTETTEDDGTHIALGLDVVYKRRVIIPYLRQFNTQPGVDDEVRKRVETSVRGWAYSRTEAQVQAAKGNGEEMWKDLVDATRPPLNLSCQKVFDEMRDQWGIDVVINSISIEDIHLPTDMQEAEQALKKGVLTARAKGAKGIQFVNVLLSAMSEALGQTFEETQAYVGSHPEVLKQVLAEAGLLIRRDQAIEGGAFMEYSGLGDGGILSALAAKFLKGGGGNPTPPAGNPGGSGGGGPSLPPFNP